MHLEEALRGQAGACGRLGSVMYADLLARAADDVATDPDEGPVAVVLRGHEDDAGPSGLALRLMGSVHRLVLERRAGVLGTFYPSVGGRFESEGAWAAFRALLDEQPEAVREWLDRPPQTNEVGRAAALWVGLRQASADTAPDGGALPVGLFEIGSSGGLNLLADRFAYVDDAGGVHGDATSPVRLDDAWHGPGPWHRRRPAPWPAVVERVGSDPMPVDVRTTGGRLSLTAYVWPDQGARHERLRGALALAQRTPYVVRRAGAAGFVDALTPAAGRLTVLWHSVMWQYLPRSEQQHVRARIDAIGAAATRESPFAHVSLEPTRRTPEQEHEFLLVLETWSGASDDGERRILARARPHGLPTTWE